MSNRVNLKKYFIVFAALVLLVILFFVFRFAQHTLDTVNLINFTEEYSDVLPQYFNEELFPSSLLEMNDINVNSNSMVIGFSMPTNAQNSYSKIKNLLTDNGWLFIDDKTYTCSSFYKNNGEINWLFVNCVDNNGGSSVVFTAD